MALNYRVLFSPSPILRISILMAFKIAAAIDSVEDFDRWRAMPEFAAIDDHPVSGAFGRRYYPAVFGADRRDETFAVLHDDEPTLLVCCSVGADALDFFGYPARFFLRSGLDEKGAANAVAVAFKQIDILAEQRQVGSLILEDTGAHGSLSAVGYECMSRQFSAELRLTGYCDLVDGEPGIRRGLRKSFKSLINWGQKNLQVVVANKTNPDRALFEQYQEFHRIVAGRVTRAQASWDAMFEWILGGYGELVLGTVESGELVAGTVVVDGKRDALYASGVYDRNRFDKPIGHWPLMLAIQRSAERGLRRFELGHLPLAGQASEKEVAIGYFKRGFANRITTSVVWSKTRINPSRDSSHQHDA